MIASGSNISGNNNDAVVGMPAEYDAERKPDAEADQQVESRAADPHRRQDFQRKHDPLDQVGVAHDQRRGTHDAFGEESVEKQPDEQRESERGAVCVAPGHFAWKTSVKKNV